MSKKIILKESQYRRMLLLLTENNSNSILSNIKPDDVLKITSDNNDIITIKVKNINNGVLDGFDDNDEEIIIDMNNYSDSNKEIIVSKVNPTSKSMVDSVVKVSKIEMVNDGDINDTDNVSDENINNNAIFNNYYKEIINDPNLKKAFYTAPSLWNYFISALKNVKARGTGIFPAYKIINKYFNYKIDQKLPGFSNKENKRAVFYLNNTLQIPYNTLSGEKNKILDISNGYHKATVRQYEAGLGDVKVLTYRSSGGSYGFKVIVKKPTDDRPDEFLCDIFVYKNNVEENKYKVENVKIKFINSDGYTSYDSLKKNK